MCNAGVGLMGPLEVLSLDSTRRIMEVNLLGTIQTIQAFLPDMKAQGRGHILVTGSTGGLHGELRASGVPHVQVLFFLRSDFLRQIRVYAKAPCLKVAKTTLGSGVLCALPQVSLLMRCTAPVSLQLREHVRVWPSSCSTSRSSEFPSPGVSPDSGKTNVLQLRFVR